MEEIKMLLETRKNELVKLKKAKEKALKKVPEGKLRICCKGERVQYYHRKNPKDFNGTYIRDSERVLVEKLAQKDYDQKVLEASEKELLAIERYLSSYPSRNVEEIHRSLHKERQKLIIPIVETDEEFVHNWESVEYQGLTFWRNQPEFYTMKGERVRSKSEVIIADYLKENSIPYRYEYPLYLEGIGEIHPDFTVLNTRTRKEFYWEHFGRMDDPEYVEKTVRKINGYELNGLFLGERLITTYETSQQPLNQKIVQALVSQYLI